MLPDTQPLLTHESNLLGVFSKTQLEVPILREDYKSTALDGAACAHAGIEDVSIALGDPDRAIRTKSNPQSHLNRRLRRSDRKP